MTTEIQSSSRPPAVTANAAGLSPKIPSDPAAARLTSVDALRGFDMFWIIGAATLVRALQGVEGLRGNAVVDFLTRQLQHVDWEGFRFYDLIFPLFLFLVGVSLPFSLDKLIAQGGRAAAVRRIVRRSLLLFALGVFYSGGLTNKWPDVALAGVLQRIAECYLCAALLYCFVPPRGLAIIGGLLLLGYWALLALVPFPDIHLDKQHVAALAKQIGSNSPAALAAATPQRVHGVYEEGYNLTNYIDFRFLPGRKRQIYYINEGLLSTLPAISISLFGALAGLLLRSARIEPRRKVAWLLAVGALGVTLGYLWSFELPIIKRIWTSSFVLLATGSSAMLLATFYLVVDVWKFRRWCQPFVWLGMNSILIYITVNILGFSKIAERLVGGNVKSFLDRQVAPGTGGLLVALVSLGLVFWLVGFLYRRKVFVRL